MQDGVTHMRLITCTVDGIAQLEETSGISRYLHAWGRVKGSELKGEQQRSGRWKDQSWKDNNRDPGGERIRAERRTTEIREVKGSDRKGERQRSGRWKSHCERRIEKFRRERMKERRRSGERFSRWGDHWQDVWDSFHRYAKIAHSFRQDFVGTLCTRVHQF